MVVTMRAGGGNGHILHGASRRRWINAYIVIIAMVFGCGILLGVMRLHSLKYTRNLNLLIRQKDDQILSAHLLLQKEREHTQEIKRKSEEMKIKLYNLRARNTELNGRISDMQSTISSLKHQQRAIELDLHEKQNEAKLALTEIVRRKEAEIEELRHHLQLCAKAESTKKNEPTFNHSQDESGDTHDEEGKNREDGASRNRGSEEESENERLIEDRSETTRKHESDRLENTREKIEQTDKEKNRYEINHHGEQKPREDDHGEANSNAGVGKTSDQESDNREMGVRRGGTRLETQESANVRKLRFGGKHGKMIQDEMEASLLMAGIENNPSGVEIKNSTSTKPVDTEYMKVKGSNFDMSKHIDDHSERNVEVADANKDLEDVDRTSTESAHNKGGDSEEEDEGRTDQPEFQF